MDGTRSSGINDSENGILRTEQTCKLLNVFAVFEVFEDKRHLQARALLISLCWPSYINIELFRIEEENLRGGCRNSIRQE